MDFFKPDSPIVIVDVGASALDDYQDVISKITAQTDHIVYGFEPNREEFLKLTSNNEKRFFNVALGDGKEAIFRRYVAPGLNSCLKPNHDYLNLFFGFKDWTKPIDATPIQTHRLDDIDEIKTVDFCKIDVQGLEGVIISNGTEKLSHAVCIQAELSPHPLYEGEESFATVCAKLEALGFQLHMFNEIHKRAFQPFKFDKADPRLGLRHLFRLDCVFIPKVSRFDMLTGEQLKKLGSL